MRQHLGPGKISEPKTEIDRIGHFHLERFELRVLVFSNDSKLPVEELPGPET
jgi:hypothetical protein